MSGNNYPTSQTPYPDNSQFYYASNLSSNHSVAGEMPWNMNLNNNNNQAAGYWPNYQIQPSQPPLPLFPPPQQPPPPPSHPPQENWYNGYSYHQQVNYPGLATYQTENVMPYYFPQYPSQSSVPHALSTSFPAFSSISQVMQREYYVGTHNVGSINVKNGKKGQISHLPKMSWNIVSPSSVAAPREGNKYKEDSFNCKREENLAVEADTCKSSTSKVDTVPVTATSSKIDCLIAQILDRPNSKPSKKRAVNADKKGRVCVCAYCKEEGHRARSCPTKPCYKCDKVGHRAKKCPEYVNSLIANTDLNFDWGKFLASQPATSKCATGANAIPRGSGRPMSINKQLTPSSLNSTAPTIVNSDSLDILLDEIPRSSTSQEESAQDDSSSAPSRKRQRSCDSLPVERNASDEFMQLINSIVEVPQKDLEIIVMAHVNTIADLERQLSQSKERVETLEREVSSLRVTNESRRSVGIQAELAVGATPDQQNNYQTSSIKVERIEELLALSGNIFASATSKYRPSEGIPRSPSTRVSTAPILKTPTTNCNMGESEVMIKTEKL